MGLSGRAPGLAFLAWCTPGRSPPGVSDHWFALVWSVRGSNTRGFSLALLPDFISWHPRTVPRRCMFLPVVRIPWVPRSDCLHSRRVYPDRAHRPRVSRPQVFSPRISTWYCPPFLTFGGASPPPWRGGGVFLPTRWRQSSWSRLHLVPRTAGPPSGFPAASHPAHDVPCSPAPSRPAVCGFRGSTHSIP